MKTHACIVILSLWVLSTVLVIPLAVGEDPKGNISFQPNVIPELEIEFVEEFFRFKWRENRFDLKLLINCEGKNHSLRDFWEKTGRVMNWENMSRKATESMYEFGYMIEDIPEEIAVNVEYLVWKIEGASFDVSEIELLELGENDTKIYLPDNLVLSYEDLWLYDFTVSHPNKHETIVKGVKGKTSWNLDPITYSDPTITVDGNYDSEANWYVWNASNVNGWGAIFNYDNMTYFYNSSKLLIDTGATFKDKNVQMSFNTTNEIAIYNKGTFQLGNLEDDTNKVTSGGCHLLFDLSGGAQDLVYYAIKDSVTKFYGCILESQTHHSVVYIYHSTAKAYFYETIFSGLQIKALDAETYFKRVTQTSQTFGSFTGFYTLNNGEFEDISVEGNQYAMVRCYGTFRDFKATNYTYLNYLYHVNDDYQYLINADVDSWNFKFGVDFTEEVYRQYTFDLTVTYPNGTAIENANVTVSHYGQGETQDFTELTDSNGQISQKTLTMGFYNYTGGNTIYSYNPYHIEITNVTGYETYNGNFTLDEKTEWTICLYPESYSWFGVTIIIGLLACFMFIIGLTTKK